MDKKGQVKVIEGLVTAAEWNDYGVPVEIKICVAGEIDYHVLKNKKSERLLNRIRDLVQVEGYVSEHNKKRTISIKTILRRSDDD